MHYARRDNSPLRAFRAVLWAFFGIRKGTASAADLASVKAWHVVVAGLAGAALFVTLILTLVQAVTR